MLIVVLAAAGGCVKSKLPPAPTAAATRQAVATQTTPTVTVGETVVSVDETPTAETTPDGSPTPIPSMTPTTEASPTPTSEPGATPTATTEPQPTATPGPTTGGFDYVVKAGDTLWGLALRFGTTVEAIKSANGLTSDIIYKGDTLTIPGAGDGGTTVTHVVQPGENLFRIALKYGTTVEAIAAANGIVNPNVVYAGQQLTIPQGGTTPGPGVRYHVVQPGETLSGIAMRYGTTPWAIAAANGIANVNYVRAGQTLRIP
jgi:LysM repeat protein